MTICYPMPFVTAVLLLLLAGCALAALLWLRRKHRQNERLFRAQFDLGNIGIAITAPDKRWRRVNPCLCAMLGYSEIELQGMTWDALTPPEELAADLVQFERVLAGEIDAYDLDKSFRRRDGSEIFVHIRVACSRCQGKVDYFILSVLDISEHKEAYSALARLNMDLERRVSERTAQLEERNQQLTVALKAAEAANLAKSVFLANMSHELRTPLNAVIGFSRLLAEAGKLNGEEKQHLEIINRAGNHLLTLINDILELSRIEAGRLQLHLAPTRLPELLTDIADLLRERAEQSGLRLELDLEGIPENVHCDGVKLKQVLINLLGNAIKFTAQGQITLHVRGQCTGEAHLLDFAVSDSGRGIAPQDQARIFEPFVQLDPASQSTGTGLGLTICRQYLRLMGSDLTLASTPGTGTTFRFQLKLRGAHQREKAPRRSFINPRLAEADRGRRILIVDDTPEARLLLVSLLAPLGFALAEAEDGEVAVRRWLEFAPELILMDWRMPVCDGLAATRVIRADTSRAQPRIAILTANAFNEDRETALAAGADDYLRKPLESEALFELLERQLQLHFQTDAPPAAAASTSLGAAELAALPADLRSELGNAVKELNQSKVFAALRPLENSAPALAAAIRERAEHFQFRSLWQWLAGEKTEI